MQTKLYIKPSNKCSITCAVSAVLKYNPGNCVPVALKSDVPFPQGAVFRPLSARPQTRRRHIAGGLWRRKNTNGRSQEHPRMCAMDPGLSAWAPAVVALVSMARLVCARKTACPSSPSHLQRRPPVTTTPVRPPAICFSGARSPIGTDEQGRIACGLVKRTARLFKKGVHQTRVLARNLMAGNPTIKAGGVLCANQTSAWPAYYKAESRLAMHWACH